ncbi:ABC transporter permease [Treponema sp.]|uniref:ABC transporter permease n=1 Tax=Treponema sp. TaxID=166 RepID=UPI0025E88EFA|nr:ABC transporter permease [Treponema sp.]MCR5217459.1 ABC transporter permease [Treponema sp.]
MNYNQDNPSTIKIDKSKFTFVHFNNAMAEPKILTKESGYFKDAMIRFAKNRGSLICFFIILLLVLYAILAPVFSSYSISDKDGYYAYASPKCSLFKNTAFWDGCSSIEVNEQNFDYLNNIPGAVKKVYGKKTYNAANIPQDWYKIKVDDYAKVGWIKKLLTKEEYQAAKNYEETTGIQLFYPVIDRSKIKSPVYKNDQNAWFETDDHGFAIKDKDGNIKDIFLYDNTEGKNEIQYYISRMEGTQLETRVLYKEWYKYEKGKYASFLFGADNSGYDIFTRLAYGARLSLLLSICVAAINLFLGIIIGSLEGYYGGTFDLIAERIKEILYQVPSVILMTLFQLYFAKKLGPVFSMFFAFIFFGWIGTSSTVRAQFYRFKGQEYVMASRTLGAKDSRLIFRHIFPNAIGFIITTSVLTIPGVIFSEANLTYLGIVNLQSDTMSSVGTMLNGAQASLSTHPHCVFFPAAFISILLICFNEFGNGLRDAFNPSLRGSEK